MGYTKVEQQVHDAFIDGYLTAKGAGGDCYRQEAEEAWRRDNTTHRPSRRKQRPSAKLPGAPGANGVRSRSQATHALTR